MTSERSRSPGSCASSPPGSSSEWRGRIVNIHPSLLPKYRGLDTHARAIAAGDRISGCSVHVVTEELDAGEVLGQAEVPIEPGDTPQSLEERVLAAEHLLYPKVLQRIRQPMSDPLDRVRAAALDLPETEEKLSHGQPTFFVAGKQFAQFRDNHHGDGRTVVCVKTSSLDEQAMLLEADPETYSKPAYYAELDFDQSRRDLVDWDHVADRIAAELGACGAAAVARSWRTMSESPSERRRRLINLGELIALAALIVSALGVWIAWKSSSEDKTTRIVEQRQPVPLTLRAHGRQRRQHALDLPVDPGHALESATVTIKGASPIELGSDGKLQASDVQAALKDRPKEPKDVTQKIPVRIDAHYVEMGADRRGGGTYVLRYRWEGGGLFGGRSVRLVGLSR